MGIEQSSTGENPDSSHLHDAVGPETTHIDPHQTSNPFYDTWLEYIRAHPKESDEIVAIASGISPEYRQYILVGFTLGLMVQKRDEEMRTLESDFSLPPQEHPQDHNTE